jgi:hypothetical protein
MLCMMPYAGLLYRFTVLLVLLYMYPGMAVTFLCLLCCKAAVFALLNARAALSALLADRSAEKSLIFPLYLFNSICSHALCLFCSVPFFSVLIGFALSDIILWSDIIL